MKLEFFRSGGPFIFFIEVILSLLLPCTNGYRKFSENIKNLGEKMKGKGKLGVTCNMAR